MVFLVAHQYYRMILHMFRLYMHAIGCKDQYKHHDMHDHGLQRSHFETLRFLDFVNLLDLKRFYSHVWRAGASLEISCEKTQTNQPVTTSSSIDSLHYKL